MSPDRHFAQIPDIIRTVAAEKIVPRFQALAEHEISAKTGPTDLVTIADIEAEAELTRILQDLDPSYAVLGEEAVSRAEVSSDLFDTHESGVWVIDPVDGTNNFASGNPRFGCMLALVERGEVVAGWIYDIMGDRMAATVKGQGVTINGIPQTFSGRKAPGELSALNGFIARKFLPKIIREDVETRLADIHSYKSYACAAHDYLALLEGERDFSMYTRIKPWDHLAGSLMIREGGGQSLKWDGSAYRAGDEWGGLINTPDADLWPRIHAHFVAPVWDKLVNASKL